MDQLEVALPLGCFQLDMQAERASVCMCEQLQRDVTPGSQGMNCFSSS